MLLTKQAPVGQVHDEEGLCVIPAKDSPKPSPGPSMLMLTGAFLCGIVANMAFHPGQQPTAATAQVAWDDAASLESELLKDGRLDRRLIDFLGDTDINEFDEKVRALMEAPAPRNCADLSKVYVVRDDEADILASLNDETDWDNDYDAFVAEAELNAEEDDDSQLDYDETLEEQETDPESFDYNLERRLHEGPMLGPLLCNADLDTAPCSGLSSLAPPAPGQPLTIPCGQCIEVDITDGSTLELPDGLVIEGKLSFPTTANVVIRTKYIFVFGLLKIVPLISGNQIKFSLYQEDHVTFVNQDLDGTCGGDGCSMGSKVIAVLGGQLDIQGIDSTCASWEKLVGVGPVKPEVFVPPADEVGTPLELEIAGECQESHSHTESLGKYTVWCPITETIKEHSGTKKGLTITNEAPSAGKSFSWPTHDGEEIDLLVRQGARVSWGHTQEANRCMIYVPVQQTGYVWQGDTLPLKFTSVQPEPQAFVPPKEGSRELTLKLAGRCHESAAHSAHLKKYTVRCPLEPTATIKDGSAMSYKFTNPATGESFTATQGVHHWAWEGHNLYFFPDIPHAEVSAMFPPGSDMEVEHVYQPGGQEFNVEEVHHWAWDGKYTFFYPEGYDISTCQQAADDFSNAFPVGHSIDVEYIASSEPAGQTITASKGVYRWAYDGKKFFFHPDVSAAEVSRIFPPGYKMQIAYSDLTQVDELKVSQEAGSCWGPGTELVLSSHTRKSQDHQKAVVTAAAPTAGDPTTFTLTLDRPIITPISQEVHTDFAVEIASLNRPVVFEADDDADNSLIGGHLIVFKTGAAQHIEGIEIKNFGQQGNLGRYPLHFHLCMSTQSVVKKNVIRDSNQRAYVMHGSDDILVADNVAYNIPGHTYFLEAGTETGTVFERNLGLEVKNMPMDSVLSLSASSGREESDDTVSVFWISNPDNTFIGNIAAGSERHGYWFETRVSGVRYLNVRAFEDNEVHGSEHHAFTTYPPGWRPNDINFIKNLKVYRNRGRGAFLHVSRNLVFEGGIFSDNGEHGVLVNRADDIVFDKTVFVGQSPYAEQMDGWRCDQGLTGIVLHPTRRADTDYSGSIRGTSLLGAKFYNWTAETTGCSAHTKPMKFGTSQVHIRAFASPHTFSEVEIDADVPAEGKPDICPLVAEYDIRDSIIHIAGDQYNTFSATGAAGFLASPKVTNMLPDGACADYNACLKFCPGACLRTISVLTNSAQAPGIRMIVKDTVSGRTIDAVGQTRNGAIRNPSTHITFTVALPKSSFDISFVDENNQLTFPEYVIPVLEAPPLCDYVTAADLNIVKPPISSCPTDIIQNGDFATGVELWQGQCVNNEFGEGRGIGGSNALVTETTCSISRGKSVSQWLDTFCLEEGATYNVEIKYRQIDQFGSTVPGCGSKDDCPVLDVRSETFEPTTGKFSSSWEEVATTDLATYTNGTAFNTLSGQWVISSTQATADRVRVVIDEQADELLIDSFSISKV